MAVQPEGIRIQFTNFMQAFLPSVSSSVSPNYKFSISHNALNMHLQEQGKDEYLLVFSAGEFYSSNTVTLLKITENCNDEIIANGNMAVKFLRSVQLLIRQENPTNIYQTIFVDVVVDRNELFKLKFNNNATKYVVADDNEIKKKSCSTSSNPQPISNKIYTVIKDVPSPQSSLVPSAPPLPPTNSPPPAYANIVPPTNSPPAYATIVPSAPPRPTYVTVGGGKSKKTKKRLTKKHKISVRKSKRSMRKK